jgi:membrane-associated phospholipid phosphatase
LLVLTWFAAFHTAAGGSVDRAVLNGFMGLQRPSVNTLATQMTQLFEPKPFIGFGALIVVVALVRRRPRIALAVAAILLCANVTTELLKHWLRSPRVLPGASHWVVTGSWPSGHATAAMSLTLCAILVAPAFLRPIVAVIGTAFAVAVSYSVLTLVSHYPSDVLGGFLVAWTWTLLIVASLLWFETRRGAGTSIDDGTRLSLRAALTAPAAGCALAVVLAGLVVMVRPHQVIDYARIHETFIGGAAAIGALALLVGTALIVAVRPRP